MIVAPVCEGCRVFGMEEHRSLKKERLSGTSEYRFLSHKGAFLVLRPFPLVATLLTPSVSHKTYIKINVAIHRLVVGF